MKPITLSRRALCLALLAGLGLGMALFAACSSETVSGVTPTPTRTPRPPTPTPTLTPSPTPTPAWPVTAFVPQGLPVPVAGTLNTALAAHPDLFAPAPSAETADVQVMLRTNSNSDATLLAEWFYAVVAPFPTLTEEVTWTDIASSWSGTPAGPFAGRPLLMTADVAATLVAIMGDPAPGAVEVVPADQIVQRAWDTRPAWAVVLFDQLDPRWKVLRVDGVSILDKEMDTGAWPLVVRVGVTGLERGVAKIQEVMDTPTSNRDPAKMTVVVMTGVTALSRATAMRMDRHGVTYPAQDIHSWLTEADVTHISNEVSFAENCPPPSDYYTMVFCSDPTFVELLEYIDVDVVELTGNHLLDWGVEAMNLSLRMYDERSIPYFGGGWDLAQAQRPLALTHGVHTFGFIGCNPAGPPSDWATDDRPGAAPCDYDLLYTQIRQLRERSILPIVTLQYWEFGQYEPTPQQRAEFRALADAGAVIVSGSQAHQPQGFDFHAGAFIHYGLGNLFFDQMWSLETRQEFVDRHVFYDGRHISTEVLTAILEDYARPRPMTPEERETLLKATFASSGW
ncbi:MAG: CapA family protein [Chloroflexota bacterium]|nr:CapA family protein [Chloroflexota bacterium]